MFPRIPRLTAAGLVALLVLSVLLGACASPPAAAPAREKEVAKTEAPKEASKPAPREAPKEAPKEPAKSAAPKEASKEPAKSSAPLKKISIPYPAISGAYGPFWLAVDAGLFARNGLEVETPYISGGSKVAQAMVAGQFPVGFMAGDAAVRANLAGGDLVMIASSVGTMLAQLMTVKDIKRMDDLKGKSIGVTRFGTVTDFAARYGLKKYGLEPEKDVAILQIGGNPEIMAAMQTGGIQGGVITPPFNVDGRKMGFNELLDLSTLGLDYQQSGLATTRSFIKSDEDTVRRVIKSYVEGVRLYFADPKQAMQALQKYAKIDDPEVLQGTYDSYLNNHQRAPYPTVKGIQFILDETAREEPKAKTANPESFVDLHFIKELEDNGFIKKLWEDAK